MRKLGFPGYADGSVALQDCFGDFVKVVDPLPPQNCLQIVVIQEFLFQVLPNQPAVVNEESRRTLEKALHLSRLKGKIIDEHAQANDHCRKDQAASDGIIPSVHSVLNCVADEQNDHELSSAHLSDLPLTAQAEQQQDGEVDHSGTQYELPVGEGDALHR